MTFAFLISIALLLGLVIGRRGTGLELAGTEGAAGARQLESIARFSSDMVSVLSRDGKIRVQTGATGSLLGLSCPDLISSPFADLIHPEDARALDQLLGLAGSESLPSGRAQRWRLRHNDGSWRHVETTCSPLLSRGKNAGWTLTTRDISEQQAREDHLRHRAMHDSLTGLPNRALFAERLAAALEQDRVGGPQLALIFIDVDNFKAINDRFGHAAGDRVLAEVGRRLRSTVRPDDLVARISGDEFAVLLLGIRYDDAALSAAERVIETFRDPVLLNGITVQVRGSLGVALAASGANTATHLLDRADRAMYRAKGEGKSCIRIAEPCEDGGPSAEGSDLSVERANPEDGRDEILAILDGRTRLRPVFQPIVDLRDGAVVGYEALARFDDVGKRPPNIWFELAHQCGLGLRLEAKAIEEAIAAAASRPPGTYLSLNMSPSALGSDEVAGVLPTDLSDVVIEVTENEMVIAGPHLDDALARLRERGARIAVDDAGAGYAGLRHLTTLRPDVIKIDRMLIDGVAGDSAKFALVDSFVRFSRELDAQVCAEGIEELSDLRVLADLDVALGQGFVLGRPIAGFGGASTPSIDAILDQTAKAMRLHRGHENFENPVADHLLEQSAALLASARSRSEVSEALQVIAAALHAEAVCVSAISDDGSGVYTVAVCGGLTEVGHYQLADFPATEKALSTGEAVQVIVGKRDADPNEQHHLVEEGHNSMLMVPIVAGNQSVGLLEMFSREYRPWSRLELARARLFSYQLGMKMHTREGMISFPLSGEDD